MDRISREYKNAGMVGYRLKVLSLLPRIGDKRRGKTRQELFQELGWQDATFVGECLQALKREGLAKCLRGRFWRQT